MIMKSPSRSAAEPASNEKPTAKKTRVEEPETVALRTVRALRKLRKRAEAALTTYQKVRNECIDASVKIELGLSAEAMAYVSKIAPELLVGEDGAKGGES